MGQLLSNLWRKLRPKADNQTLSFDHQAASRDYTEKKQPAESHCINISDDHLQPLLNSSIGIWGSHVNNNYTNNNLGSTSSAPRITTVVDVSSEDDEDDHQSANHHITLCLDNTEKKQLAESHCINISEHLQPYLLNWGSYNHNNLGYSSTPDTTVVDLSREEEKKKKNYVDQVLEKKVTTRVTYVPSVRTLGPYTSAQKLLLVGEGDFSFSACLAVAFGTSNPNIIATSLNSEDFLIKHYRKFPANKEKLETRGNMVLHGVDATKMVKHPVLGQKVFDCIIFNFPHVGKFGRGHSELCLQQKLVTDFLRNAKKMIKRDGEIHITSKSNGFFGKWDIPKLGSRQGLYLIEQVKFNRSKYTGYQTKFGFGGDRYFHCNPSKTYKFALSNY